MDSELDRRELYALVWSVPMRELAKRYGISDVALKKKCTAASIPVPPRGYWAKKAAGRRTVQAPLPPRDPGQSGIIQFGKRFYWASTQESEDEFLAFKPEPPDFEEPLESVHERIVKRVGRVPQPRGLDRPHRLIASLLAADDKRRAEAAVSLYAWDKPLFDTPFEKRRLRVLNAIFTALERAGSKPSLRGKEARELHARVGDVGLEWEFDDPRQVGRDRHHGYRPPIGNTEAGTPMKLQVGSWMLPSDFQRSWQDTKEAKLESQLTEIVVQMIFAGEVRHRAHRQEHYEWTLKRQDAIREKRRNQQEEAEQKERERQRQLAQARIDRLLADAEAYRRADDIRAYVDVVLNKITEGSVASDEALQRWAAWARDQADLLDPVASGRFKNSIEDT